VAEVGRVKAENGQAMSGSNGLNPFRTYAHILRQPPCSYCMIAIRFKSTCKSIVVPVQSDVLCIVFTNNDA
jgi:hypothetical protein